ncbi:hypothetical protein THAOC_24855, partial [Thalassiosira oceanica]
DGSPGKDAGPRQERGRPLLQQDSPLRCRLRLLPRRPCPDLQVGSPRREDPPYARTGRLSDEILLPLSPVPRRDATACTASRQMTAAACVGPAEFARRSRGPREASAATPDGNSFLIIPSVSSLAATRSSPLEVCHPGGSSPAQGTAHSPRRETIAPAVPAGPPVVLTVLAAASGNPPRTPPFG